MQSNIASLLLLYNSCLLCLSSSLTCITSFSYLVITFLSSSSLRMGAFLKVILSLIEVLFFSSFNFSNRSPDMRLSACLVKGEEKYDKKYFCDYLSKCNLFTMCTVVHVF